MLKNVMWAAALIAVLGGAASADDRKGKPELLKAGEYSATAKALVCSACAGEIEKTLKGFPGLEAVTVAAEDGAVRFKVKKGSAVKLDELQAALKAGSDKMGMGADYRLRDLKKVPSKGKKKR